MNKNLIWRKSCISVAVLIITGVVVYLLYPGDEKRIKKVIEKAENAIIREDINQLMEHISFNYRDNYGGNYIQFKKRAASAFNRFDTFDVKTDIMRVSVKGEQAQAEINMSIIASDGKNRGYVIGDAGSAEDIKILLEKSPYEWKVIKMEKNDAPPN